MFSVIFRAKMKPGKEDEAIAKMTQMAADVQENEPGVLLYALHRPKDDPSELVVMEAYKDDEAFKAHAGTPHMADMRSSFAELFDPTTVKMERLDRIAGFARG